MANRRRESSSSESDDGEDEGRDLVQVAGAGRRDENAISFRHFLQPQSDVVPTWHNRHHPRSGNSASAPVDLVDIPGGLPDFVQDHLVIEAQVGGEPPPEHPILANAELPLDLAVLNEIKSKFQNPSQNMVGEIEGAFGPAPTPALPDFLSDGPMHYDATASSSGLEAPSDRGRVFSCSSTGGSLGRTPYSGRNPSSLNIESLLEQIQRLERDVQERDRRIRSLESVILEQKAELVSVYEQIAEFEEIRARREESGQGDAADVDRVRNGQNPNVRVREIAQRAESLLTELMKEIRLLKKED